MKINKIYGIIRRLVSKPIAYLVPLNRKEIELLEYNFEFYKNLNHSDRKKYNYLIKHFKLSKSIKSSPDILLTKYHKTFLACVAVRLIRKIGLKHYDYINNIIIFPDKFETHEFSFKLDGVTGENGYLGLSWRAIIRGISNPVDGDCVITHEFAHAIDLKSGDFDGIPKLNSENDENIWEKIFIKDFQQLKYELKNLVPIISDESELFAYLSEFFFEKPQFLKEKFPNVFILFNKFYKEYDIDK
ncbi:phosphoenolpyruvate:glucose-phosphotransferase regulator [Leptospira yanagawae serovar Saopaulo str. Sao Paulo = ATCC 700523]|uniref:Phosphoenolpyruvate:glucose-phosphotransferase regulator n=1 Tax=Leptospira yanagawae serovar Saopaulo str. Sao Paulo = ATCC 700523 TaxID=1249483 RepID=A0A5E8H7H7_9LEPT|nr:phosphoenolpyruvate--glucose-phosphotransferase regulator [Leptospira yanagawae]EOQ87391.1 phosphoenolpyruvate:glucose-phosphotransferase regulator [Leptospira yanagawae serovar Saopaulo str. Sao Paulo = ATCC 700523]